MNPTGSPRVLQPLGQGNSKSLDVVCHFLRLLRFAGVWEKNSVKGARGSVYLSVLVGHDFPFDPSPHHCLDCFVTNQEVTVSVRGSNI